MLDCVNVGEEDRRGYRHWRMIELEREIQEEYDRVASEIQNANISLGPNSLTIGEILRAHFLIANYFYLEGEGLGGIGPKDIGLLESATYRQAVSFGGTPKWTNLFDITATLFFGIAKNHAFHDANKRTALLCMLHQLYKQKWCPSINERQLEDFAVEVADDQLSRYARYNQLVKDGDPDPEVRFISWYLRNNTRKIERTSYSITYRELYTILNRFDFSLEFPSGNFISIVRKETRKRFLLLGPTKVEFKVIGQVGFPRWTAEVRSNALKHVREVTGLTAKSGFDSESFFRGVDPLQSLITTYHAPLMRLANR